MKRSLHNRFCARLAVALLISGYASIPAHAQQGMSPDARKYVQHVVNKFREFAINRDNIDWKKVEASAMAAAPQAQTIPETFPAIKAALNELKDRRAGYRPATGNLIVADMLDCALPAPLSPPTLPPNIGYIRLAPEPAANVRVMSDIATRIQNLIRDKDAEGATGWIVDLRAFRYGAFAPAIVGLGPLLGDGTAYYTMFHNTGEQQYIAGQSKITHDGAPVELVVQKVSMVHKKPKVALLLGPATAGAGEVAAIAFAGRKDARTFGSATCGISPFVSWANPLSDGAKLYVTSAVFADRNRKKYFGPIEPDEKVDDPAAVLESAIKWLNSAN